MSHPLTYEIRLALAKETGSPYQVAKKYGVHLDTAKKYMRLATEYRERCVTPPKKEIERAVSEEAQKERHAEQVARGYAAYKAELARQRKSGARLPRFTIRILSTYEAELFDAETEETLPLRSETEARRRVFEILGRRVTSADVVVI